MKLDNFKLKIELVPSTVWFSSVYQICKKQGRLAHWKKIKEELFKREGRRCWICGMENTKLEAHEFWEYDDERCVQRLVAIHHLCTLCHKIKHIGYWLHTKKGLAQLKEGGLSREDLVRHFCRVNNCNPQDFEIAEDEALRLWGIRSQYEWKQDFGGWI
ncbi:MAG: hypothetical protein QW491_13545 [Thermoproteota archaeon]